MWEKKSLLSGHFQDLGWIERRWQMQQGQG
jgi:hypothetical protein